MSPNIVKCFQKVLCVCGSVCISHEYMSVVPLSRRWGLDSLGLPGS